MARIVNEEKHASKRNEILDAAQRFIYTKGYEQMTVQDILDDLAISKGAFYHYFDAKPAVLEALVQRMQDEVERVLLPIVHDPHTSALEKLQRFFGTFDRLRMTEQAMVINLLHVWYTDDNAIVRQKVDAAIVKWRAPLLNEIVQQGIQEGIFNAVYPDLAGEIILALMQSMGNTHARFMLSLASGADEQIGIEGIVRSHAAYMDAVERTIGAPTNSFYRVDAQAVRIWVKAVKQKENVHERHSS